MKKILFTSVAMLGLITLGACQAEAPQTSTVKQEQIETKNVPTFSAQAFFETTTYILASGAGYAFGPETGDILMTSDESGVWNAYRANTETGTRTALTNSTTNPIRALSWFPNNERLLYTSDGGGDELDHLYVREKDGTVKDLTPGNPVKASFLGWSASGDRFFVMTNERDARTFDVYAYNTATYERDMLFENDGLQVDAISKDGLSRFDKKPNLGR